MMLGRTISSSVRVTGPPFAKQRKNGAARAHYVAKSYTCDIVPGLPCSLLARVSKRSARSLVAPYTVVGLTALPVLVNITFPTFWRKHRSTKL